MAENKILLPVVTRDIAEIVEKESLSNKLFIEESFQKISRCNPNIAYFLNKVRLKEDDSLYPWNCGILVYKLLEKSGKLPVVSDFVCAEFAKDAENGLYSPGNYFIELAEKIRKENRCVMDTIVSQAKHYEKAECSTAIAGLVVYGLLDMQADMNLITGEINRIFSAKKGNDLEARMRDAVRSENYELAAKLRDEIKQKKK